MKKLRREVPQRRRRIPKLEIDSVLKEVLIWTLISIGGGGAFATIFCLVWQAFGGKVVWGW